MARHLVLSLDFELRWGVYDVCDRHGLNLDAYRKNLEGVRDAVPALLELFRQTDVRATWATVAAVACEGWDDYHQRAPELPKYLDSHLRWDSAVERADPEGRLYFAPDLVKAVAAAPGQELASHTFSHIYFRELGCTRGDVEADTAALARFFTERFGRAPTSLVFPCNQVAFQDVLRNWGIRTWRENQDAWYYQVNSLPEEQTIFCRAARLTDSLANLGRRDSLVDSTGAQRASFFIRFNLPKALWVLQRRRITAEARALRDGHALHLWCHPHNLGADPKATISMLRELLESIREATKGKLVSSTMTEFYQSQSRS
jgi:peptidoglycan/xylan/chitin deacetylase (PgdA/CDA1 family)